MAGTGRPIKIRRRNASLPTNGEMVIVADRIVYAQLICLKPFHFFS